MHLALILRSFAFSVIIYYIPHTYKCYSLFYVLPLSYFSEMSSVKLGRSARVGNNLTLPGLFASPLFFFIRLQAYAAKYFSHRISRTTATVAHLLSATKEIKVVRAAHRNALSATEKFLRLAADFRTNRARTGPGTVCRRAEKREAMSANASPSDKLGSWYNVWNVHERNEASVLTRRPGHVNPAGQFHENRLPISVSLALPSFPLCSSLRCDTPRVISPFLRVFYRFRPRFRSIMAADFRFG